MPQRLAVIAVAVLLAVAPALAAPELLAAWSFDEIAGRCRDAGPGHYAATMRPGGITRVPGLFSGALSFSGNHYLTASEKLSSDGLKGFAVSAWVAPGDLSTYREIIRKEDGDNRFLFSFQGDGTILSLGLNIGGYVECDAPLDPAQARDGQWHLAAGSFDGTTMRVYWDGKEIGALARPGTIAAGGQAPVCLGSSGGGECFQGLLDELRLYRMPLSAAEVATLYEQGRQVLATAAQAVPADEPQVGAPLAHWTANESTLSRMLHGLPAALDVTSETPVARCPGVHGSALLLAGTPALPAALGPLLRDLPGLSFSAWVRPNDLSGFREILRQECPERLLFSFQEDGTILSLGLNIGGYVECDAPVQAASLLDGDWHHCAGTFDGRTMRVFLDGKEVRSLDRPGTLSLSREALAFIGSSGGSGEYFHGGLDDLRVYGSALTAAQVAQVHQAGRLALQRSSDALAADLARLYPREGAAAGLSAVLAGAARAVAELTTPLTRDLAEAFLRRLRQDFAPETDTLRNATGLEPVELLTDESGDLQAQTAARMVDLLLEYRPLTPQQLAKQTPEQRAHWQQAQALGERLTALQQQGASARFSPEWLQIALQASKGVQLRPYVHEPVAPYVKPETPVTRDLTATEAQETLRRDWLHQCGGNPSPERIRQEIAWTRALALRLHRLDSAVAVHPVGGASSPEPLPFLGDAERRPRRTATSRPLAVSVAVSTLGRPPVGRHPAVAAAVRTGRALAGPPSPAVAVSDVNRTLSSLSSAADKLTAPDPELYFRVRELKRQIAFSNPLLDFDQVLFVDMPYPQGSEWPHETRHRLGYMAVPGARLQVLRGLSPAGNLRQLMPRAPLHGSFWRPDLSWDASKVVFCFKPHNEKSFHLYEIGLDGQGLTQLTDGPYDDLDPIYLPDGHLMFSTTRAHTYVRCMPPTNAYVLARCDRDGRNVYLVSANNEPDYLPSVMPDGRVLYTRWEYTDKPLWRAQGLWTVNPDGTQVATYWGNQSVWPDLMKDARAIPGSSRVMFTGSAHHNWFAGSVGIVDTARGVNFPAGLTKVTADAAWPECGNGPTDPVEAADYHASGSYGGYYSPYPLGEEDFLVSASRNGKFVLYLMDVHGNRELIYEGAGNILHALPVRARPRPPVLPDAVQWPTAAERDRPAAGTLYSYDVYEGVAPELKNKARYLRVLSIDPKTYTLWYQRPYISTGPVVSMVQSEGVKRILGEVPIEADGSVSFTAPPGKALHFQLLDESHRALQTMRSFVGVMPGERRGCVGCHAQMSGAPRVARQPLAVRHAPAAITPPPWPDTSVSYARYVQPVLDRYCGRCHQGEGSARKVLDLTRRPGYAMFDEPYVTLIGRPTWAAPYQPPTNPPPGFNLAGTLMVEGYTTTDPAAYAAPAPLTGLSYKSPLVRLAASGKHHGVKVDDESLLRLICWVDAICPYLGDEEVRAMPDPQFQGMDWLAIRPRIATAPRVTRPGPVD